MTLQAAMAKAINFGEPFNENRPGKVEFYEYPDDMAERILAALRADPEVLTAMAEALWGVLGWTNQPDHRPSGLLQCDNDNPEWARVTARLLDALLGEPS